ncbi:MAG TPA: hypothetical protein CFH81_08155 [Sulfurovum sp. UBA12169]|nr:MAG TPA: hypothetical protein CFH81_08155 [Sulfurovum sp. UBA12169]
MSLFALHKNKGKKMKRAGHIAVFLLFVSSNLFAESFEGSRSAGNESSYRYDSDQTVIQSYLDAINILRSQPRKCGNKGAFKAAPPLKWSDKLYRASMEHSKDMATHGMLCHAGSGKSTDVTGMKKSWMRQASQASERGKFHGYTYKKAFAFAENIGAGQKTLPDIVQAWVKSPSHCANIMNPNFREMALTKSINPDTRYKTFWTLNLGYRR